MNNDTIPQDKKDIMNRLNRIEGQIKGIKRMVEENRNCTEVLMQVAAVRAASNKLGSIILKSYCNDCVLDILEQKGSDEAKKELTQTLQKYMSFLD